MLKLRHYDVNEYGDIHNHGSQFADTHQFVPPFEFGTFESS